MSLSSSNVVAVVVGEALIDITRRLGTANDEAVAHPGGSSANVALTLGRLGRPVELATWLGKDDYGQQITEHLQASAVSFTKGFDGASKTTTAQAMIDENGAATYTFDVDWSLPGPIPLPTNTGFIHTGSFSALVSPGNQTVLETMISGRRQALTSYDPNIRPALLDSPEQTKPQIEELVASSDMVKVSDEDLEWLYPELSLSEVADRWFASKGPNLIVITCGGKGSVAFTREGISAKASPVSVEVVDTIGAGDSFMGALIDALWKRDLFGREGAQAIASLSEQTVTEILLEASRVASVTVSRAGANPPWANELLS